MPLWIKDKISYIFSSRKKYGFLKCKLCQIECLTPASIPLPLGGGTGGEMWLRTLPFHTSLWYMRENNLRTKPQPPLPSQSLFNTLALCHKNLVSFFITSVFLTITFKHTRIVSTFIFRPLMAWSSACSKYCMQFPSDVVLRI